MDILEHKNKEEFLEYRASEQKIREEHNKELAKLDQARQEQKASITVAFEGRSQSEVWEERFAEIEARLDKLEQVGRKQ